jgi:hypothetical protein
MILIAHTVMPLRDIALDPEIQALFPAYTPAEAADLQTAIRNGVTLPPLVLGQYPGDDSRQTGKITLVDGYNRLAALRAAGQQRASVLTYRFNSRASAVATAIRMNAKRRHLTPDQRASAGLRLAELLSPTDLSAKRAAAGQAGGDAKAALANTTVVVFARPATPAPATPTRAPASASRGDPQVATHQDSAIDRAAAEVGASPSSLRAWKLIQDAGIDALRLAIRHRKLSLAAGAQIARLPAADQPDALAVAISARAAARASRRAARASTGDPQVAPPPPAPAPASASASAPAVPPASASASEPAASHTTPGPAGQPPASAALSPEATAPAPAAGRPALATTILLPPPTPLPQPAAGYSLPAAGPCGLAATVEAMAGDAAARLRRHLADLQTHGCTEPDHERCRKAVYDLHIECLRYLMRLNGIENPGILSRPSLERLTATQLADLEKQES